MHSSVTCPNIKTMNWDSKPCSQRYLRASKWKSETAINRIENTLNWRRKYGLYDILLNADSVEPEVRCYSDTINLSSDYGIQAVTGKQITFGFDAKGRPAIYMIPSRQNTDDPVRQIQFVVWMLERAIDLMGPGVEYVAAFVHFNQTNKRSQELWLFSSTSQIKGNILPCRPVEQFFPSSKITILNVLDLPYSLISLSSSLPSWKSSCLSSIP